MEFESVQIAPMLAAPAAFSSESLSEGPGEIEVDVELTRTRKGGDGGRGAEEGKGEARTSVERKRDERRVVRFMMALPARTGNRIPAM